MSEPAADGARRAEALLRLLTDGDEEGAGGLLAELDEVRDLVFTGAGLTAVARAEARSLPPAQRAQANTRQLRLGILRDAQRDNPAGLRTWLRQAGEEILLIRAQQKVADAVTAVDQDWTAARVAAQATGSETASNAAAST